MKFISTDMNFDFVELLPFVERPFRAKLNAAKIHKDLDSLKNNTYKLRNYFKKLRTKIAFIEDPTNDEYVAVSGETDWKNNSPIVTVNIHTDHYDTFKFTKDAWWHFKYVFISILFHEMIHMMQFINRGSETSGSARYVKSGKSKIDQRREYHSDKDEIQAHAFQVWLDYKISRSRLSVQERVKKCLKRNYSSHLQDILKLFDYDFENNSTLRQLCQEILRWERRYNSFILKQI